MRVRRSLFLSLSIRTERAIDVARLLRGEIVARKRNVIVATVAGRRGTHALDSRAVALIQAVPSDDWVEIEALGDIADPDLIGRLCTIGVLLSDADDPPAREGRLADTVLSDSDWSEEAATYWAAMLESDRAVRGRKTRVDKSFEQVVAGSEASFERRVEKFGRPPAPFYERQDVEARTSLTRSAMDEGLGALLLRRRTVRAFDQSQSLLLEDLATVLHATFGVLGTTPLSADVTVLQRGSPSGGSLHPIEAYLLVRDVEATATGLFHYNGRRHSLDRLRELESEQVQAQAVDFAAGQTYARGAHVLVVLVARLDRSQWKYRNSIRTPLVVAMDAGHLSQTFYLSCTERGLGCFYSAAIDAPLVNDALKLPEFEQCAVGILGCGPVSAKGDPFSLKRLPLDGRVR